MTTQTTGHKIVLLGDSGVGKTCLISRFISGNFDANVNSTNGASYASKKIEYANLGKTLVLDIWDTAGQEKYKSLTKFFYKDAAMVILVYDITRKESFDNLKNFWYTEIQQYGDAAQRYRCRPPLRLPPLWLRLWPLRLRQALWLRLLWLRQ